MSLEGFTREVVSLGARLIELRRELLPRLSPLARLAYRRIANDEEELQLAYQPSVKNDFAVELAGSRRRESVLRTTLIGPHRDDLELTLAERSAAQFASEGQKRSIAIALKMAQAEYVTGLVGAPPILLIDDVMGELDAKRRAGLLPLLQRAHRARSQVFMTATEEHWPDELARDSVKWEVAAGTLRPRP
jgi:DNA replication and repair protein RecF